MWYFYLRKTTAMKRIITFSLLVLLLSFGISYVAFSENTPFGKTKKENVPSSSVCPSCMFKNFKLYGNVQVVESFPDIKVQIVESFPDLKVKQVESFPDQCGKWKFVTSFPDFKVQFVTSFPDIKIKYVESFPGCN